MEPSTCIFNCRHPVWGGEGACSVDQHGAPVCLCDAGFASRDALGHANCVPFQALVSGYLVLAALSLLTLALLGHHLAGYRHVSDDARRSRRTAARLGALLCGCLYAMGMLILGVSLAGLGGGTGLNDPGVVQILYLVLLPAAMYALCMIAKFWVEGLPSQLIPAESFAMKLRNASDQKDLFVAIGGLNAGGVSALGVATIFVPVWPQLIADIAAALGTLSTVAVILFVAVQITRCINEASAKGKHSGDLFYAQARRNLWQQALAMSSVGFVTCGAILAKRLTTSGRGTPIIFWNIQASTCNVACGLFAHFTRFEQPVAARRWLARSSRTYAEDASSTRRLSSFLAVGTSGSQQLLQLLNPQEWQNMARRGSGYLRQAQKQLHDRGLGGAPGGQHGGPAETAETDKRERRSTVRWSGTSTFGGTNGDIVSSSKKTARVLPTEGSMDASVRNTPLASP